MKEIEFYYDFASPNAYLVEAVLPAIAAGHAATIKRMPILLGGLFKSIGNVPPLVRFADLPAKTEYLRIEFDRFVARHEVPFLWNPHFPILSTPLMRAALVAQGKDWEDEFRSAIYRQCWVEGADMTDPKVFAQALAANNLPTADILPAIQSNSVKQALFDATRAAAERGVFGVPTLFVGQEKFFGKDALGDLDWVLGRN